MIVIGLGPWILYYSFGIDLPWYSSFLVIVILAIGVTIPQAPGFFGVFQFSCAAALILVGIEENDALIFATVLWFLGVIPVTFVGMIYLYIGKMSLSQLMKKE